MFFSLLMFLLISSRFLDGKVVVMVLGLLFFLLVEWWRLVLWWV